VRSNDRERSETNERNEVEDRGLKININPTSQKEQDGEIFTRLESQVERSVTELQRGNDGHCGGVEELETPS
jgi:hypothetical protein